MKKIFILLTLLNLSPLSGSDWDYKYLNLKNLIKASEFISTAEIQSIKEEIEDGKVTQKVTFMVDTVLKGAPKDKVFIYHASYIRELGEMPKSYYLNSPPGTRFLLFLNKKSGEYISVLGPCGALKISDYIEDKVLWYTDTSKAQRFADHWKEKSLKEVITEIKSADQDGAEQRR